MCKADFKFNSIIYIQNKDKKVFLIDCVIAFIMIILIMIYIRNVSILQNFTKNPKKKLSNIYGRLNKKSMCCYKCINNRFLVIHNRGNKLE